jgi:hypothetical protein
VPRFNWAWNDFAVESRVQTPALASIHDHWTDESAGHYRLVALKLWARHFIKRHPVVAEILEWSFAASVGLLLTVGH